jgi:hypothetical protein
MVRAALLLPFLPFPPSAAAPPAIQVGSELSVPLPDLDALRARHPALPATFTLHGPGNGAPRTVTLALDLADEAIPPAIVIDLGPFGPCTQVDREIRAGDGTRLLADSLATQAAAALPSPETPVSGEAAVEPGVVAPPVPLPRILLPDPARLRVAACPAPPRRLSAAEVTFPVVSDTDHPALASQNTVVLSRSSLAPDDPRSRGLYFSYRKARFDPATGQLAGYRKMLVEIPLSPEWARGTGDLTLDLPPSGYALHATEARETDGQRWDNPAGYPMLGASSSGLFQGGQTADTDDLERIYVTNVPDGAGVVRFDPRSAAFEQPPVNLAAALREFLPAGDGWRRSWDMDLAQVVCARGRVFLVFDRHYRAVTPNGRFETCSGVVSLPQDHWDDPVRFRAGLRLHAACWPDARFSLYPEELPAGTTRRAGAPVETDRGIAFGVWRLDLDDAGETLRLVRIPGLHELNPDISPPLPRARQVLREGLPKQRFLNAGAAGRPLIRFTTGEVSLTRAAAALLLPGSPAPPRADAAGRFLSDFPGAPSGTVTLRFDLPAKIRAEAARFPELAASLSGPAQGPNYGVIALPDEPGQALGVCEYSYLLSRLDFSARAREGHVRRTYLPLLRDGRPSSQPVALGLGPYHLAWVRSEGTRWLHASGYTGIRRFRHAGPGISGDAYLAEPVHERLRPEPVDATPRDPVKDYLHVLPALGGRLVDFGRGRPGRGGGPYSAALELFSASSPGVSHTASRLTRAYGLYTPASRVVLPTDGTPVRQEIFTASGPIRAEYLEALDPASRPRNHDPKVFLHDVLADGSLRDRFGFSVPVAGGGEDAASLAFSPDRLRLVLLQGNGTLLSFTPGTRTFSDGLRLPPGHRVISFSRPSMSLWTSPDDRIWFLTRTAEEVARLDFHEVLVSPEGRLEVRPHLTLVCPDGAAADSFEGVVRTFLPDLERRDGSWDLVLGGPTENGGSTTVRVIDDFVPPRR